MAFAFFRAEAAQAVSNTALQISAISKAGSSESGDGSAGLERPVLIGEVVTLTLIFEAAEGTTSNVTADVILPSGMEYIAGFQSASAPPLAIPLDHPRALVLLALATLGIGISVLSWRGASGVRT